MIPGIVSNCWKKQFDAGESLVALIEVALERGYRIIELRQTALGEFESGEDHLPNAKALANLPQLFPEVQFNIAISVPFLDETMNVDHWVFVAGREAARAIAGKFVPHLRLVDLMATGESLRESMANQQIGTSIAKLTTSMTDVDGILSVEHSLQPWSLFSSAFLDARECLGEKSSALQICYDPCNLLVSGDGDEATEITRSLSADQLSMVHFKQRQHGRSLPTVGEGDIDWKSQLVALDEMGYPGPALFEVDAHENIWHNLEKSKQYLEQLGLVLQR